MGLSIMFLTGTWKLFAWSGFSFLGKLIVSDSID